MRKSIIVLQGISCSGKSSTLRILRNKLEKKKYFYLIHGKEKKNCKEFRLFVVAIEGKLIGITSYGDKLEIIKEYLKILENFNCNILICACRSRGETLDFPKYFSSYRIEFVKKRIIDIVSKQNKLNNSDANKIYKRIKEIL
jgi:GTP-binding protein EngB required for normal cell division